MDCLQASEVLSASRDGELIDAARLAEARAHCAVCPQCASLLRLLDRTQSVPAPRAPQRLVAHVEAAAIEAAADARDTRPAADSLPHSTRAPSAARPWAWTSRLTALASAAAVLLVALTAGTIALVGMGGQRAEQATTMLEEDSATAPSAAMPESGAAEDSTALRADELAAPPYVVLEGTVYVLSSEPTPSALTTAGAVFSDLGSGSPGSHTAFAAPGTDDPLFVKQEAGGFLSFSRVVRTLGRAEYALSSDVDIASFGGWPTLPAGVPQPKEADGSPAFSRLGFDDLGVDVYGPRIDGFDDGFAVAPDTAPDDPAAGNPNWTWWERVR